MLRIMALWLLLSLAMTGAVSPSYAGVLGKAVAGALEKKASAKAIPKSSPSKSLSRSEKIYAQDRMNHLRAPLIVLPEERIVVRYTRTRAEAEDALRKGLPPEHHMAYLPPPVAAVPDKRIAIGDWGLSPAQAREAFGLDYTPEAMVVMRLPKGFRGSIAEVAGGKNGAKEFISPDAVKIDDVLYMRLLSIPSTLH